MRFELLRLGMKVHHPAHGPGIVRAISEISADIDFDGGRKTISADDRDLQPGEPMVAVTGLDTPLGEFMKHCVGSVLRQLGIERDEGAIEGLGARWHGGKVILQPADTSLLSKEIELETFFHKIVMMRNNLRVLEQKINAAAKLSEAEKVELQQYITRCYGSMTTFNVLFKEKEDQF